MQDLRETARDARVRAVHHRWVMKLAMIVVLAACQAATAEPPPEKRFEHDMMVRFHMHQNFDLVRAIERLLIRGKLDEAKRFAEAIAMSPDEPAHGPWAAQAAVVRERASAVARATSVDDALRKETQLAAACADCHRESYGSAVFEKPPAIPPDRPTLDARMARHRWAADRMWESVIGDLDDAWREGLDVLAAAPLELDAARAPFARELQRLANTARRTKKPMANRAATYGEILVVCAGCHAKSR
jgi:cytochrome c553